MVTMAFEYNLVMTTIGRELQFFCNDTLTTTELNNFPTYLRVQSTNYFPCLMKGRRLMIMIVMITTKRKL